MRAIVRVAASIEVQLAPTEADALLLENELIRALRPKLNVEGKFSFLYPMLGLARSPQHTLLCFTTDAEAYSGFDLRWYGCFRSRRRARAAFESLDELLGLLGHREGKLRGPHLRGSSLRGYRQLSAGLVAELASFLSGTSRQGLGTLALRLLEKPRARRMAGDVQGHLRTLADFYETDLEPLHRALREAGLPGTRVSQSERDPLFLRRRAALGPQAVTSASGRGRRRPVQRRRRGSTNRAAHGSQRVAAAQGLASSAPAVSHEGAKPASQAPR